MSRIYNHIQDPVDTRDHLFQVAKPQAVPETFSLQNLPAILDQKNLGTCAANEISNALVYLLKKEKKNLMQPSRLFLYYFARILDGSDTSQDTGITIRSGMKSISVYGDCPEVEWPYVLDKFTEKPTQSAINTALLVSKGFQYSSVPQSLSAIQQVLLSGFPVVIGIQVYDSFETDTVARTGIVPLPKPSENCLGGHCVSIYGYDNNKKTFKMMNSWGTDWGQNGFFELPFSYVLNSKLADSFWVARYFE